MTRRLALLVIVSAVIMIVFKGAQKQQLSPIKVLLFVNSLVINDLSLRYVPPSWQLIFYRKYEGKIS
jgi:hypothetical protein